MPKITIRTIKSQIKKAGLKVSDFRVHHSDSSKTIVVTAKGYHFSLLETKKMHSDGVFAALMLDRRQTAEKLTDYLEEFMASSGLEVEPAFDATVLVIK